MLTTILIHQFTKDLNRLKEEITAYKNEDKLWALEANILNTGGNLSMHLVGNLNHFIGHILGKTDYKRNRSFEFEGSNATRVEILHQIDDTIQIIERSLKSLDHKELEKEYPIQIFKDKAPMNIAHMLVHLSNHLNYHLGQINYHRRLLDR